MHCSLEISPLRFSATIIYCNRGCLRNSPLVHDNPLIGLVIACPDSLSVNIVCITSLRGSLLPRANDMRHDVRFALLVAIELRVGISTPLCSRAVGHLAVEIPGSFGSALTVSTLPDELWGCVAEKLPQRGKRGAYYQEVAFDNAVQKPVLAFLFVLSKESGSAMILKVGQSINTYIHRLAYETVQDGSAVTRSCGRMDTRTTEETIVLWHVISTYSFDNRVLQNVCLQ